MKQSKTWNLLVLCTGNSARSVMAEALFNVLGEGRFKAYSAGSTPTGKVNPFAIERVEAIGYPSNALRSKSWDEFGTPEAPPMDFVITVCDNAAGEACPLWPGAPVRAHWSFPDPAAVEGDDERKRREFGTVFAQIRRRVERFVALPLETMDRAAMQRALDAIGATEPAKEPQ